MPWRRFPLLHFLSIPYRVGVRTRLLMFERGWVVPRKLPKPVMSIGNLTVGGTGKTPIVIWIAQWLVSKGVKVCILSRGYRRKSQAPRLLVSNFDKVLVGVDEAGDEPFLMANRCPGTCVAVGADRYRLGQWVLEQCPVDVFILDDGFQHVGLHRDINLLLIDTSDPEGLYDVLPAGRLREPLAGALRATTLILTRATEGSQNQRILDSIYAAVGQDIPKIRTRFVPVTINHLVTEKMQCSSQIKGKRALIFSGIGNSASFRLTIEECGVSIVDELVFPDHHDYSSHDMSKIRDRTRQSAVDLILTTEKDAVKVEKLLEPIDNIWFVGLDVRFLKGRDTLEGILDETMTLAKTTPNRMGFECE